MVWQIAGAGWIGVDLFFVLSGFLITGICLDHSGPGFFRVFYTRRAMRILPAYAVVVVACLLVAIFTTGTLPTGFGWVATFTTNIPIARTGSWASVPLWAQHFWSLAVEEQFYLFWPLVISLLPRSRRLYLAASSIPLALLVRCLIVLGGVSPLGAYVSMPARIDTLAFGAVLAILIRDELRWPQIVARARGAANAPAIRWVIALLVVCLVITQLSDSNGGRPHGTLMVTIGYSAIATLAGVTLLAALAGDANSELRKMLRRPPLRALGRYSYAIYLVHVPVNIALHSYGFSAEGSMGVVGYVALGAALSCGLAAVSWRCLERPILNLKSRVPYPSKKHPATSGALDPRSASVTV